MPIAGDIIACLLRSPERTGESHARPLWRSKFNRKVFDHGNRRTTPNWSSLDAEESYTKRKAPIEVHRETGHGVRLRSSTSDPAKPANIVDEQSLLRRPFRVSPRFPWLEPFFQIDMPIAGDLIACLFRSPQRTREPHVRPLWRSRFKRQISNRGNRGITRKWSSFSDPCQSCNGDPLRQQIRDAGVEPFILELRAERGGSARARSSARAASTAGARSDDRFTPAGPDLNQVAPPSCPM